MELYNMKSAEEQAIELLFELRTHRRVLDIAQSSAKLDRDDVLKVMRHIEDMAEALLASLKAENSRWCD